jgi:hypothetical protein
MKSSPTLILLLAAQCLALQLRPGCTTMAGLGTFGPRPPLMLAKKGKKKGRPPAPAPAAKSAAAAPPPAASLPPLSPLPPLTPLPPLQPTAAAPSAPSTAPVSPPSTAPVSRPVPQVPLVLAEGVDPSEAVARTAMPSSGAAERPAASSRCAAAPPEIDEALRLDRNIRVEDEPIVRLPSFDDFAKRDGARGAATPEPSSARGAAGGAERKLPLINPGKPLYQPKEEEKKSLAEKIVFQSAWVGIGTLVAIEIFINTPLFQQVLFSPPYLHPFSLFTSLHPRSIYVPSYRRIYIASRPPYLYACIPALFLHPRPICINAFPLDLHPFTPANSGQAGHPELTRRRQHRRRAQQGGQRHLR